MKSIEGKDFNGHPVVNLTTALILVSVLLCTIFFSHDIIQATSQSVFGFLILWLAIATFFSFFACYQFTASFLIYTFSMFIAWRLAGMYGLTFLSTSLFLVFILIFINFIYCARSNLKEPQLYKHAVSLEEWQLIFIRLYVGLNFIPHFTEKLFAGGGPRAEDVVAFIHLGVPHPEFFVIAAGLCEFGAAIALTLGFLMRIGALGAVFYLAIATYLGHHFSLGFIWANPGGGWEYALMWMVVILSFVLIGKHSFSIDQCLEDKYNTPAWLKKWM